MEEISTSEQKINDNQTKLAQLNEVNNKLSTQVNKLLK